MPGARGAAAVEVDGWVVKSEKERDAVVALRERLADLADEADATHNLSDECLVRFARARRCKLDQAEKMYRATSKWRKETNPRRIAETFEPSNLISTFRPGGFLGVDKLGCPIFYDRLGQCDPGVLKHIRRCAPIGRNALATEQIRDFEIQKQELLTEIFARLSKDQGKQQYQTFVVQDLRGLGMHHLVKATLDLVQAILFVLDEYYPLRFRKLVIIHPPMVFSAAWNIVKHFVHETTREQVEVVSGDPSKVLLQHIDADQLPKALGGNLVINGDDYCDPPIMKAGRVPKDFPATPSKYHENPVGLPMHLYVKPRSSVRVHSGDFGGSLVDALKAENERIEKEKAAKEADPEEPEGLLGMFQRTIDVVTEWVLNLTYDDQDEAARAKEAKYAQTDSSASTVSASPAPVVPPPQDHKSVGSPPPTKSCCCVIS